MAMADSYKGLTIRIGADTTGLTNALKQAERAARSSQAQLNRMSKALQFDPNSLMASRASLAAMTERAAALTTQLSMVKTAMAGTSNEAKQLASSHRNVLNESTRVRDVYNSINEKIAKMKREVVEGNEEFQKAVKEAGGEAEGMVNEFYEGMVEAGLVSEKTANEIERLGDESRETGAKLKTLNEAVSFKDAKAQVALLEAEIEKLGYEFVELVKKENLLSNEGLARIRREAEITDGTMDRLEAEIQQVDKALQMNPRNIGLIAKQMSLSEQKTDQLNDKLRQSTRRMNELIAAGAKTDKVSLENAYENSVKLEHELAECKIELERAEGEASRLRTEFEKMKVSGDATSEEMEKMSAAVIEADARVEQLNGSIEEMGARLEQAQMTEEFRKTRIEAERTRAEINSINKMKFGGLGSNWAYAIRSMGTVFSATITPLAQIAGQKIVEAMDTLDASYRDMRKTVNGTEEDFEHLKQAAIEFSQTHAVSADTILEIEAMGGQLGITVDKLEEFGRVASNLEIATDLDAETIAKDMGQLSNIMQWVDGDMTRFGDALVRLGNNMPAQESSIVAISTRIGSMGTILHMSTDEVLAWSAALASTGQGAEAAGTALAKTMAQIESAVAAGGEKLDGFAKVAEMSSEEFANAWSSGQVSDVLRAFIGGLNDIQDSGGSATKTLQDLGINGVRQKQAIQGLMNTVGVLDDALEMSSNAWNGAADSWGQAGDAAYEADQKSQGFSGQLQILKNNATALAIAVGESLAPWLKILTGIIQRVAKWYDSLNGGTKQLINVMGLLSVAIGPVMTVFGVLAQFMSGPLLTAYDKIIAAATKEIAAQWGVEEATVNLTRAEKRHAIQTRAMAGASAAATAVLKGLGISLAIAAAAFAAMKLVDYTKDVIKHKNAIKDLSDANRVLAKEVEGASGTIGDNLVNSMKVAHDEVKELNNTVDEFAEKWRDSAKDIASTDASYKLVQERIDKLVTADGKLKNPSSPAAIADLSGALERLNELAGTSYYLDEETMAIKAQGEEAIVTKDAIDQLIESKKQEAKVDAYKALYTEALEKQAEAQKAVNDAQQAYDEMYARYQNAPLDQKNGYIQDLTLLENELEDAKDDYYALGDSAKYYGDQMAIAQADTQGFASSLHVDLAGVWDSTISGFESANGSVDEFIQHLHEAGASQTDLKSLTAEEWATILETYNGDINEAKSLVDSFASSNRTKGAEATSNLAKGMRENKDAIRTEAAAHGLTYEQAFRRTNFKQLGIDATLGVAAGLTAWSALHAIDQGGATVANRVRDTIHRTGQGGSPWRTTMQEGEWASEGLAIGLLDGIEDVKNASKKTALAAISVTDDVFSSMNYSDVSTAVRNAAADASRIMSGQTLATQFALSANGLGTVNNYSINGIDYADNETIKAAFAVILGEMQRLGRM